MSGEKARSEIKELLARQRTTPKGGGEPGAHERCAAVLISDDFTLVCSRSLGHHAYECYDPDRDKTFIVPDRRVTSRIHLPRR